MTILTHEEFLKLAREKFPDKIIVSLLKCTQQQLDEANENHHTNLTLEDFEKYGEQAWVIDSKCPVCSSALAGIFGTFEWGIQHGTGYCSQCNKAQFQLYHYIGEDKVLVRCFALVGF